MKHNIDDNFIEQLKNRYYEIYISILMVGDRNLKRSIIILNIFIELNIIPSKVKDKMTGFIRLMWWAEALNDIETSKAKNHPLLDNFTNPTEFELGYFNKIIEIIELELEDENKDNIQAHIRDKYNALFNLISPDEKKEQIPDIFLFSFFILVEVLIKKKMNYFNNLDFFVSKNNLNDLDYTSDLVNKAQKNLELFLKQSLYKENLFINLISQALFYYINKFKQVNYDIYLFDQKKHRFGLILYLLTKYIKFKIINKFFKK